MRIHDFLGDGENTMSEKVCTPVFAALLILQKNHEMPSDLGTKMALEKAFLNFLEKLVQHEILGKGQSENEAENEATAFQAAVLAKALEPANGLDTGKIYDPVLKKEVECKMSLGMVLTILLLALEDETDRYWKSPYKDRLSKFYSILKKSGARCHSGLRNDWVKGILHADYSDIYFMEELGGTLQEFAREFFEKKLLRHLEWQPMNGFVILCQWLDVTNPERNEFEKFIGKYTHEPNRESAILAIKSPLRVFLEDRLTTMGLNPADTKKNPSKPYERSIAEMLDHTVIYSESLACPHPDALGKIIEIISELLEDRKKSNFPEALKARFFACKTVNDITEQAIDVWRDFIYLRRQASQYQFAFPAGKEAQNLVNYVTVFLPSIDKLLNNPECAWAEFRETLKTCEKSLSDYVAQYKKQNNHFDLIRNSFAVSRDVPPSKMKAFCKEISDLVRAPDVWITDEMLSAWQTSRVTKEDDQDVFTLQQYDVARLCWQALIISPAKWSPIFRDFFGTRIIPIIEKPAENDQLHADVINTSYKHVLAQFKALLELSKIPVCLEFPQALNWNNEGIHIIRTVEDLIKALKIPGIDKLAFIQALSLPLNFFQNVDALKKILDLFAKDIRPEILPRLLNFGHSTLLGDHYNLSEILEPLAIEKRWSFLLNIRRAEIPNSEWPWGFLRSEPKAQMYYEVVHLLAPFDRLELLKQVYAFNRGDNEYFANCDESLHEIFRDLPEEHWTAVLELINPYSFKINSIPSLSNFLNFVPKHFLKPFFKWLGKTKSQALETEKFAELLTSFHKKKLLYFLKVMFQLIVDEPSLRHLMPPLLEAFIRISPTLAEEEKIQVLKLISSITELLYRQYPDINALIKGLSEEGRWQFIGSLNAKWAIQYLEDLPKTYWSTLADRTGFSAQLAKSDLSDLWIFVSPALWEMVIKNFELDLSRILSNSAACDEALKLVEISELARVALLLDPEKKWLLAINSFEKLCEVIKRSSFSKVFSALGNDVGSLIRTKADILTLWELRPLEYKILMKSLPVDDFLLSFEDYLPFLQKMRELEFPYEEMFDFLLIAFSHQTQALIHLEKIALCFEPKNREALRREFLIFVIDNIKGKPEDFHVSLYQATGDAHWKAALEIVNEKWDWPAQYKLRRLSTSVIPFLQQEPSIATDRLLQICKVHLKLVKYEGDFFSKIFEACPELRTLYVFKKVMETNPGWATTIDLLSTSHLKHLPQADALSALKLRAENHAFGWQDFRDSYEELNSCFAAFEWMHIVISELLKKNKTLCVPTDVLRKIHIKLSSEEFAKLFDIQDPIILDGLSKIRDFDASMEELPLTFLFYSTGKPPSIGLTDFIKFITMLSPWAYHEKVPFFKALAKQVGASGLGDNSTQRVSIFLSSACSLEIFSLFKNTPEFCTRLVEIFITGDGHGALQNFIYENIHDIFSNIPANNALLHHVLSRYSPERCPDIFSRIPKQYLVLFTFFNDGGIPATVNPVNLRTLEKFFLHEPKQEKILRAYASRIIKVCSHYSTYFIYKSASNPAVKTPNQFVGFKSIKPDSEGMTFFDELVDLFQPLLKPSGFASFFGTSLITAQAQKIINRIRDLEARFRAESLTLNSQVDRERNENEINRALLYFLGNQLEEIEAKGEYHSTIAVALHFAIVLVGFPDCGGHLDKKYYVYPEIPAEPIKTVAAPESSSHDEPRHPTDLSTLYTRPRRSEEQYTIERDPVENSNLL